MRRSLFVVGAALAVHGAAAVQLHAQGSGVDQQSACMTARVGTGVAMPCDDGSAVYFGPAALAMQPSAISFGAAIIRSSNTFRYDPAFAPARSEIEREPETRVIPQGFVNFRVNPRLAVGIGAFAPYGSGLKWPVCPVDEPRCSEPNFEGRYTGYDNELRNIYIQPTVAYQVIPNRLSVGAGVDFVRSRIAVQRRAAGPAALGLAGTDVADVRLSGEGSGVTGHVSAILRASEKTWFGARYLHSATVEMDGDAVFNQVLTGVPVVDQQVGLQFNPGAPLEDQGIGTEIELPSQLVLGISHRPMERLNLMFDFQRTGWESFDEFAIDFRGAGAGDTLRLNYENTNTFRFAADLAVSQQLALRAGFRYNTAATPRATPFLPEGERNYYTAGLGYRVTPRLSADLAYQFVHQPDRRGALRPGGDLVGVFGADAQVFGFTLAYRFGGMMQ